MHDFIKTIISALQEWTKKEIKKNTVNIPPNLATTEDIQKVVNTINEDIQDMQDAVNSKMDKENPVGTGSFSMNRRNGETVGAYSYAVGYNTTASGDYSYAESYNTRASGEASHAEGSTTIASGDRSHAEGYETQASGNSSHTEGYYTIASGDNSHAEGHSTTASGYNSHAEGWGTYATGDYSHTEGVTTTASGEASHAEGGNTIASGSGSHAEGARTTASGENQHVQGKWNIENPNYAHIVGNGSYNNRSNAHTLDWNGNAWFQGNVFVGGASQEDGSKKLITQEEILAPKNFFDLVDTKTGYIYRIEVKNGQLTSRSVLASLVVTTMPTLSFTDGEKIIPVGIVITGIGQDGSEYIVDDYVITPEFASYNNPYMTITADNASIDIPITVNPFDPTVELIDFDYTTNNDGTYTITGWKQTYKGESSTEFIVPNNHNVII